MPLSHKFAKRHVSFAPPVRDIITHRCRLDTRQFAVQVTDVNSATRVTLIHSVGERLAA